MQQQAYNLNLINRFLTVRLLCFDLLKTNKMISTSREEIIFIKFFQDILKQTQLQLNYMSLI